MLRLRRTSKAYLSIVIVAAGSAGRMGFDKIFTDLAGRPVIEHSLSIFQICDIVKEIVVVVKNDDLEKAGDICRKFNKVRKVICGGDRRIDSVFSGVLETDKRAVLIGVHDGARPLVTEKIIKDTAELALERGAAIPAIHVYDTIKIAGEDRKIVETPARNELFAVQTPQIFDVDILKGALQKAVTENMDITDDSMAVESIGMPVYLSEGSVQNLKLTNPIDFITAEGIIKSYENRSRL